MKNVKIFLIFICVFFCQILNAQVEYGHMNKFPFPYNVQPSELDIKGNILKVSYTMYKLKSEYGDIVLNGREDTALFEYDAKGQLLNFYNWTGTLFGLRHTSYSQVYDDKGNSLSVHRNLEYFYEDGKLAKVHRGLTLYRLRYTNGVLTKIDCYSYQSGELESTEYYQNGDLVKVVYFPSIVRKTEEVKTYTYRNHKLFNSNGNVYTYNERGLYSPNNGSYKFSYEYDDKGNWIKRYELEKDKYGNIQTGYLTVRKITYR